MKQFFLSIAILFSLTTFAQIQVNEPTTYKGIDLSTCYVHIVINGEITFQLDSVGGIIKADTAYVLYAHQYPNMKAYFAGEDCIQVDQLIDSYSYLNDDHYYQVYKAALLRKNPSWSADNIIILQ